MAQVKSSEPKTVKVIVDRPFRMPEYEMQGDTPVATGMRVTEVDEVVTLDRELARDVLAGNKATAVDLDPAKAKQQIALADEHRAARAKALALQAKADAARAAAPSEFEAFKATMPELIAAAVAQALVQAGIGAHAPKG